MEGKTIKRILAILASFVFAALTIAVGVVFFNWIHFAAWSRYVTEGDIWTLILLVFTAALLRLFYFIKRNSGGAISKVSPEVAAYPVGSGIPRYSPGFARWLPIRAEVSSNRAFLTRWSRHPRRPQHAIDRRDSNPKLSRNPFPRNPLPVQFENLGTLSPSRRFATLAVHHGFASTPESYAKSAVFVTFLVRCA